jgi:phosphoribosyl-AMP cyclohydrolase
MIKPEEKANIKSIKELKFDSSGLIPAIVQDYKTKEVLMLAYMNVDSLAKTLGVKKTCFWSRSRQSYWVKGETSGHFQFVKSIAYDCDKDALLIKVRQVGAACHTMKRSCFYRKLKIK